ncbi:hypothetical protein BDL97_15G071300 [Sphagnum fallax]|nr:hypothetical protein BDL97_15G071300 [Sphagnum fallax]
MSAAPLTCIKLRSRTPGPFAVPPQYVNAVDLVAAMPRRQRKPQPQPFNHFLAVPQLQDQQADPEHEELAALQASASPLNSSAKSHKSAASLGGVTPKLVPDAPLCKLEANSNPPTASHMSASNLELNPAVPRTSRTSASSATLPSRHGSRASSTRTAAANHPSREMTTKSFQKRLRAVQTPGTSSSSNLLPEPNSPKSVVSSGSSNSSHAARLDGNKQEQPNPEAEARHRCNRGMGFSPGSTINKTQLFNTSTPTSSCCSSQLSTRLHR